MVNRYISFAQGLALSVPIGVAYQFFVAEKREPINLTRKAFLIGFLVFVTFPLAGCFFLSLFLDQIYYHTEGWTFPKFIACVFFGSYVGLLVHSFPLPKNPDVEERPKPAKAERKKLTPAHRIIAYVFYGCLYGLFFANLPGVAFSGAVVYGVVWAVYSLRTTTHKPKLKGLGPTHPAIKIVVGLFFGAQGAAFIIPLWWLSRAIAVIELRALAQTLLCFVLQVVIYALVYMMLSK